MRRKRFQKPTIKKERGYWVAQFRDINGQKRKRSFGPVATTKKYDAEQKLAAILAPINSRTAEPQPDCHFKDFVEKVYLPFYKGKWKESTAGCNEDRIGNHLMPVFAHRPLNGFTRDELQSFLQEKAAAGLSYSVVAHLRWDLRQIFALAQTDGYIRNNPAEVMYVPTEAPRPAKTVMTFDEVQLLFQVLGLRERLVAGFAVLAGLRPGEIFGLQREDVEHGYADVRRRVYHGKVGTPKTFKSIRQAALGDKLERMLRAWLELLPDTGPDGWLFPSEQITTPLRVANCWNRHFVPKLRGVGLGWINFQVMRRTHATLLSELDVDPQVRAGQMGHSVDVNQNEYTQASLKRKRQAVEVLEQALSIQ